MNRLEQRIRRLEGQSLACNHRLPIILTNPTEEELERRKTELDSCPECRGQERPKIVIMHYPELNGSR